MFAGSHSRPSVAFAWSGLIGIAPLGLLLGKIRATDLRERFGLLYVFVMGSMTRRLQEVKMEVSLPKELTWPLPRRSPLRVQQGKGSGYAHL